MFPFEKYVPFFFPVLLQNINLLLSMAARATSRMIQAGLIVKSRGLKSKCLQVPSPKQKHDECMDVIDWVFGFSRWVMFHHRHHQLPLSTYPLWIPLCHYVDSNVGSCWVMLGHPVGFMASFCFNLRWCRPGRPPFSTAGAASCRAWSRRGSQVCRDTTNFKQQKRLVCSGLIHSISQYHTTWINMVSCFDIMQNFIWRWFDVDLTFRYITPLKLWHGQAPQLTLSRDAPQWEMPHNVAWQLWNWEQQPVGRGLGLVLGTNTCPIRAIL